MFKNAITNKRISVVLVIILTPLAMVVVVIWVFDKRINSIENKVESPDEFITLSTRFMLT